jgi:hypothetical protein
LHIEYKNSLIQEFGGRNTEAFEARNSYNRKEDEVVDIYEVS